MPRPWRLLLIVSLWFVPSRASAQTVDDIRWVTNGAVWAVAEQDGITYVGGDFTMVSQATGCGVAPTTAGVVAPGFPKVVGQILTVISDGAGGWYVGGLFTSIGGLPRNNLAHLGSDLSVASWNPNVSDEVDALELSGAGTIYVGGRFLMVGGVPRQRLAEIDLGTGLLLPLVIPMNNTVRTLVRSGSVMYVGGDFTTANAAPRTRLCAVNIPTRTLAIWNPGSDGPVTTLEIASRPGPTTTILVGGSFSTVGGQSRANLAEISTAGAATAWNPSPNGIVRDIQEHGVDYIVGEFTMMNGIPRNRVAAVDASGAVQAWNPNASGAVHTLVWSGSSVYLGGLFDTVNGVPRRNAAKVDEVNGVPDSWNPEPNQLVRALCPGGVGQIYMGGDFTGLGGIPRRNLAAFRDYDGGVTDWDPNPTGTVVALAVRSFGPEVYTVYAGGNFTQIGGLPRLRMAALHPKTGVPTPWLADTDNTVYSIALNDTAVVMGGDFSTVNGTPANRLATLSHAGGPVGAFGGTALPSAVFAVGLGGNTIHVGGMFGYASFDLSTRAQNAYQNPSVNGAVRALAPLGTSAWIGGDFTTVGGLPRQRLALISGTTVSAWNPGADGIVRSLVRGESNAIIIGGDFLNVSSAARSRLAQLDPTTGAALPWTMNVADNKVYALDTSGPHVRVGGTFHGIGNLPQANFAAVGPARFTGCLQPPNGSYAGGRPKALEVLDYDRDGIDDVAVCEDLGPSGYVKILKGTGSASFLYAQVLNPATLPRDLAVADFDFDGFDDLAVTEEGDAAGVGVLSIWHNVAGSFQPWTSMPLVGHADGLAVGDYDADGILDVAVCLTDSAMTIKRGGLQLLKGGGTNAVWDGTFAQALKLPRDIWQSVGRKVMAMDANKDGWMDFFYSGVNNSSELEVHLGPNMVENCQSVTMVSTPAGNSGVALAAGEFNLDGRTDLVSCFARALRIRYRSADSTCGIWFPNGGSFVLPLPSTPRDLAVMDLDNDGFNDVLVAFDSLNTLAWCRGVDEYPFAGVSAPVNLAVQDVYSIALGDFVQNGIADVVASGAICAQVGVWENPNTPFSPQMVQVVSPNGGEGWSQAALSPPPLEESSGIFEPASSEENGIVLNSSPPARLASAQGIEWTKSGLVGGVDVEVTRNDGHSWQPIARGVDGNWINWIVTPPGTGIARVRVRDSVHRARVDVSDAPFAIFAGVTGASSGPLQSGLRLLGMHPAHGAVKFALDVSSPADVAVVLYDAAGRSVRTLARGRYGPGSHDLAWDGKDDRGAGCRRGVYFVRTRIGTFEGTRKVVML